MDRCDELIKQAWEGEILGEAVFATWAEILSAGEAMWRRFADLEALVASLIEPVATRRGIAVDPAPIETAARQYAATTQPDEQAAALEAVLRFVPSALESYRELATVITGDDSWLAQELIDHEQALEHDIRAVLGTGDGDGQAVQRFLDRHTATRAG